MEVLWNTIGNMNKVTVHDKFIIVDSCHVQTGSWNYTESAKRNSENVLILWNQPNTAKAYLGHWQSRFNQGTPYP
ncbi:phospholipase D-like domain-containing protein [Dechloromonas sp. ZS-1]|uniref:phospholipase D-like domain-containing protein n=1 Tax=Dechloromonas sp. ZS-1 TaxID=3138067 RepID=UPI0031FC3B9C